MALTASQRTEVRFYMGYSHRFNQSDDHLEKSMNSLASDADAEAKVIVVLAKLVTIDTNIEAVYPRLKATKVCDIDVAGCKEMGAFKSEGRRQVGRLASILAVPVRFDIYSSSRYSITGTYGGPIGGGNFGLHG